MQSRVVKNAVWIIACRIIQSLLGLVIGMFMARYMGPSNYGLINYAASIVAFAAPIMKLGIDSILVNEIINNPNDEGKILGTTILMNLIGAFLSCIGILFFVLIANKGDKETLIVCLLYSTTLFAQALEMIVYWYQAKLLSKYMSIVSVASYLVVSIYKFYLLATGKSIEWFAVSQTFDYLFISVILFFLYAKLGGEKFQFSFSVGKRLLHRSKYFIISSMMVTIFAQTDKIMLNIIMNDAETGFYSAAAVCSGVTSFVFSAILDSARPIIFENKNTDDSSYDKSMQYLYSVIFYLSLLQSIFMTVFGNVLVLILYGNAFLNSIPLLKIITWTSIFSYLGAVRNIWLLAEEKQKYILPINISGAIANVVLNLILIPFSGAVGAAIASLITQVFTNVILGWIITPLRNVNRIMLKGLNPKNTVYFIKQLIKKKRS